MTSAHALRLRLDGAALQRNYHWFERQAGVPVTAAVKANGYGLGARGVVSQLLKVGCQRFGVSSWAEAEPLADLAPELLVFHGFRADDAALARALPNCRPLLNSVGQIANWKKLFPARPADLMVDTGMNRLGISLSELDVADGLNLVTVHSHLACADEPEHPLNQLQIERFRQVANHFPKAGHVLANSAGVCLGAAAHFGGVRPGLGLYGGINHPAMQVEPVVFPETQILQVRTVHPGEGVGYGVTFVAERETKVAIVNLGYADGLPRQLQPALRFHVGGQVFPAIGRVSMDLISIDVTGADVAEGDWLSLDFNLQKLEQHGPLGQYELLTSLSSRYERIWQ